MALISFDYFTITSCSSTLRSFFFFLLRTAPFCFSWKLRLMSVGGSPYKGVFFKGGFRARQEFFVGQRRGAKGYNYIVTIPGEISNSFVSHFLINSNLSRGKWKITRLDLQLTLYYEFSSKKQLEYRYWEFYGAQQALEKTKKKGGRPVKFTANDKYLLVSVGSKKQNRGEWKLYTAKWEGGFPQQLKVRFELTVKNSSKYLKMLKENCIDMSNFLVMRQTLEEAVETDLLAQHRFVMRDWDYYKSQAKPQRARPERSSQKAPSKRQSRFQGELVSVARALKSFAELMRTKKSTFSHKQVRYLNDQLSSREWRISWNIREEWSVIPTKGNPLWTPLFERLPLKAVARRKAFDDRRKALESLALKINTIVRDCERLPKRTKKYVSEPTANKLIRDIFEVAVKYKVMDETADRLPRAKFRYSTDFDDQPEYVQNIIRWRWMVKNEKLNTNEGGLYL